MTRFDRLLEGIKNSRLIAILLLVGVGLVAIGNAIDALEKVKSLLGHGKAAEPAKIDVHVQDERFQPDSLERLRLEREVRALEYELAKARNDPEFLNDFEKVRTIEKKTTTLLMDIESATENSGKLEKIENVITAVGLTIGHMHARGWSSRPEAARVLRHLEEIRFQAELLKEKFRERVPNPAPAPDAQARR